MNFEQRKSCLYQLGVFLDDFLKKKKPIQCLEFNLDDHQYFEHQLNLAVSLNPWFTEDNVLSMLKSWKEALEKVKIDRWLSNYKIQESSRKQTIGVVMAGNVPMVGFHDFLSVFISGNIFLGKLSSDDKILIPALAKMLQKVNPKTEEMIRFTTEKLENFDAIIATGSNNSARYFENYFAKYPNIIRKNRSGVGVLSGNETTAELEKLGLDIFTYYGLGCRNVSKLFVPENYSFDPLFQSLEKYNQVIVNHKYANNYDFNKSIYLVNNEKHFDNGFLLLKESEQFSSPISVLYYEYYNDLGTLNNKLKTKSEEIQCVVSHSDLIDPRIDFGDSQKPELWDYADGIDTLKFLLTLESE